MPRQNPPSLKKYLQALVCFSLLAKVAPLQGAAYTVNSLADTNTGSGTSGTLRFCINQANTTTGPNTIAFSSGGTLTLTQSLPPIGPNISSISSGGSTVIIAGGTTFQPFFILPATGSPPVAPTVSITGTFTVTGASVGGSGGGGGYGGGGGALGAGGGIFVANGSTVTLQGVSFTGCSAVGGTGGSGSGVPSVSGPFGGGGGGGMNGGTGGNTLSGSAANPLGGGGGGGGYGGPGGSVTGTGYGGGGGGGALFAGGAGSAGGGGGGSDAAAGSPGTTTVGGNGATGLVPAMDTGGMGGGAGSAGGPGAGEGGGGGGGPSTGGQSGGFGGTSNLGGGGGGGDPTAGTNAGYGASSLSLLGGGGGGGASSTGAVANAGGNGGNGGSFGGGGGGGDCTNFANGGGQGGNGGFGGGGGGETAGGASLAAAGFGNGGFGAGGGSGYAIATSGMGGFGAASGTSSASAGSGGGGAALGGAIFVGVGSTLNMQGVFSAPAGSSITPGTGGVGAITASGTDIFLMSSGTINFGNSNTVAIGSAITSDAGSGGGSTTTGGIIMSGTGILTLGGANTYTGSNTLNAGTVQISADGNLGAATNPVVFSGGTLELTAAVPLNGSRPIQLSGVGTIQADAPGSVINGPISGSGPIQVTGAGTVQFFALNSYTGGTNLFGGGTLQIAAPGNVSTGPIGFGNGSTAGTLELLAGFGSTTLPNNITVTAPGGTLLIDAVSTPTLSGNITGTSGNLTINQPGGGTLILSGVNPFSGTMTLPAGTLDINSQAGLFGINLVNNGTLDFTQTGGAVSEGSISGTGSLNVLGPGIVVLAGNSTFTGPTTVASAALLVDGSSTGSPITVNSGALLGGTGQILTATLQTGSALAPGNFGPGTLSGNTFTFDTGSNFISFLGNSSAGQIAASGALNITPGANLAITLQGAVSPQVTRYVLATAGSITPGVQFNLTNPLPSFILEILYTPNEILLLVFAPPYANFLPPGNPRNTAVCFTQLALQGHSDLTELMKILDLQVPSQLQHSFNQMHPANFDDLAYAAENVAERIRQMYTSALPAAAGDDLPR